MDIRSCDNWVVVFLNGAAPHYRILAGRSGSYMTGDSWRMNSGITSVEEDGDYFLFYGSSGSCYKCHKEQYCLRMNTAGIWNQLQELHGDKVALMPEDTDWKLVDWIISG